MTGQAGPGSPFSAVLPQGSLSLSPFSYRGLRYRGEVISSERWDPALGQPLEGDLYFRIVALLNPRSVPAGDIQDSRIAVCVPGRGTSRRRGQTDRELAALRETQALYITRGERETAPIRSYLDRQRRELEAQLISEEAARYASAQIEVYHRPGGTPEGSSPPRRPATWFTEIGEAVFG